MFRFGFNGGHSMIYLNWILRSKNFDSISLERGLKKREINKYPNGFRWSLPYSNMQLYWNDRIDAIENPLTFLFIVSSKANSTNIWNASCLRRRWFSYFFFSPPQVITLLCLSVHLFSFFVHINCLDRIWVLSRV